MGLRIESPAFAHNASIPAQFTCEGADVSPPLVFGGIPEAARSLALIVDDPDAPDPRAPRMTWVHWVLYDLSPNTHELPENASRSSALTGSHEGLNDWKRPGYGGPCPPIGRHRYFFKLYALDSLIGDLDRPTKASLMLSIEGRVLGFAELIGTYEKHGGR